MDLSTADVLLRRWAGEGHGTLIFVCDSALTHVEGLKYRPREDGKKGFYLCNYIEVDIYSRVQLLP